jgi:WD40 repeat protein
MECLARINAPLTKGIKTVAFSNDGKLLAATALDDDHNVAIFDWSTKPKTG